MGLDDFKSDNDTEQEEKETDEDDEEAASDDEKTEKITGLEAFESNNYFDENGEQEEQDKEGPEWAMSITPERWNDMSERERVAHVRARHISDFRPEIQIDESWSWTRAIEVRCICDEIFTFEDTGMCLSCGRVYDEDGRVVKLIEEPQQQ